MKAEEHVFQCELGDKQKLPKALSAITASISRDTHNHYDHLL